MRTYCLAQGTLRSADLDGKEIQRGGDVHIHIADSLRCTVKTNTVL